jgi:hypothetical protein
MRDPSSESGGRCVGRIVAFVTRNMPRSRTSRAAKLFVLKNLAAHSHLSNPNAGHDPGKEYARCAGRQQSRNRVVSVRFDINTSMLNELLPTRTLYISKHKEERVSQPGEQIAAEPLDRHGDLRLVDIRGCDVLGSANKCECGTIFTRHIFQAEPRLAAGLPQVLSAKRNAI